MVGSPLKAYELKFLKLNSKCHQEELILSDTAQQEDLHLQNVTCNDDIYIPRVIVLNNNINCI